LLAAKGGGHQFLEADRKLPVERLLLLQHGDAAQVWQ
jgi:hypothetical protein